MKEIFNLSKIKEAISNIGFKQTNERPQHLPGLRKLSVGKQYLIFTTLTVASVVGSFGLFFEYLQEEMSVECLKSHLE